MKEGAWEPPTRCALGQRQNPEGSQFGRCLGHKPCLLPWPGDLASLVPISAMVAFGGSSKLGLTCCPRGSGEVGHQVIVLRVSGPEAGTPGLSNVLLLCRKVGQIFWLNYYHFCHPQTSNLQRTGGPHLKFIDRSKCSFCFEDSEGSGG